MLRSVFAEATREGRSPDSIRMTMAKSLTWVAVPSVAAMVAGPAARPFDAARFAAARGTLYLVAPGTQGVVIEPLFRCFVDFAQRQATLAGSRTPAGKLDPPLLLALDEVRQIVRVPLDVWLADSAGKGVCIIAVAHGMGQLREGWGEDGAATIWDTTNKIILPGVQDRAVLEDVADVCGQVGAREGDRRVQVQAVPPAFVSQLLRPPRVHPGRRRQSRGGQAAARLGPAVLPPPPRGRPAPAQRLPGTGPAGPRPGGHAPDLGGPHPAPGRGAGTRRGTRPARLGGHGRNGGPSGVTGHNPPAGGDRPEEEPVPDARRLQEELEAARKAGQAVPYETLAALAAAVGDLRSQVRFVHSVVDRSGLAFAKDTRALVLRLTATVDAMDAKVAGLDQAVQDLQDSGSRVCAPNWAAMDQATRAAELAKLSEWVARVLLPGYRVDPPLRPCWRAHLPVVWELGTVWAEWRRVYDRKAPELAGALDWHNRWLPGALERSQRALSGCTERQCILAASAAARHPP